MLTKKMKIGTLESYVQKHESALSTASLAEDLFQEVKPLHEIGTTLLP